MEEITEEISRKNLTNKEFKKLITNTILKDFEVVIKRDIEEQRELECVITEYKERLKHFDDFIDDLDEQLFEHTFYYLKYNFLLEGEELDWDTVGNIYDNIDIEDLFKKKHNMDFEEYALKALEKAEKELKRRYSIIKKRYRKKHSYF